MIMKNITAIFRQRIPSTVWYLAISLLTISVISYVMQSSQAEEEASKILRLNIEDIQTTIHDNKASAYTIRLESDAQAISKAHAFANMIALKPSIVSDPRELEHIRKMLDVDELHVADKNGILIGSTLSDYIGYDFSSDPQSKEFLLGIYYKDFELAQKPMPKGIDKTMFQYAGVARIDQPGIVQIGYKPQRVEKVMQAVDIKRVAKDWRIGATGQAIVTDFEGRILSSFDGKLVGSKLTSFGPKTDAIRGPEGSFTAPAGNRGSCLFMYKAYENYLIIGFLPKDEIYAGATRSGIIMLLLSTLSIGISLFWNLRRPKGPDDAHVARKKPNA